MRERRRIPPSVLVLTMVTLLVTPIAAAAASGLPATITMDPLAGGPGETVLVTGSGFPGGTDVRLELATPGGDHQLGTATADAGGYLRATVVLPGDAQPGAWELIAAAGGTTASYAFNAGPAVAGALTDPAAATTTAEPALSSGNSLSDILVMLVVAVLIACGIGAGAYVYRLVTVGDTQPGMSIGEDPIWGGASQTGDPAGTATEEPSWLETRPDHSPTES